MLKKGKRKICKHITMAKRDFNFRLWPLLIVFFIILAVAGNGLAASFLADMVVEMEKGKQTTSKFFLQDNQYRMDVEEDGMTLTILVNRENKKTRVIDPSQKTYLEFANDDMRSLMKNPFEAYYLYMVKKNSVKTLGKEIVNNITCDKQELGQNGKAFMTVWVSLKHNFPIKMINHLNGYRIELQGIRDVPLNPDFFKVPAEFVKREPPKPQTVKPEKKIAITGKETFKAPIGRRVGSGGILSVTVSPQKHIALILRNENQGESSVTIHTLKNNIPVTVKSMGNKIINFEKLWDKKEISLEKLPNPDSLEIEVTKGMVYVIVNQEFPIWEKEQSHENFLREPVEFGFLTRPKLKIVCQLTGNSQDKPESKLKVTFFKDKYKTPVLSEEISLKNGQSRQWEFNADQNILSGKVDMQKGAVQFRLHQFPKKTATKQPTVKTAPQPKPKAVTQFTVTHPSGTGKPLTPGKDLTVTVTGVSGDASGTIFLYSDRKKTKKIDELKFKLKRKQAKSFAVSGGKNVGWATVWVHKGSFKVKLDQSPNAKAAPTPKTSGGVAAPSGAGEQTAGSDTIMNGQVPLYPGSKVVNQSEAGNMILAKLEAVATVSDVAAFYRKELPQAGWKQAMEIPQGDKISIMFTRGRDNLVLEARQKQEKVKFSLNLLKK